MGPFIKEKNEFIDEKGALYSYRMAEGIKKHIEKVGLSNGLTWDTIKKKFYYIDSLKYCILGFDYDSESGTIGNTYLGTLNWKI